MLAPTVYDTFNRTVSGGWGTSTSGHAWTATVGADSSTVATTSNTPGLGVHTMLTSGVRICTVGPNVADSDVRFGWGIDAAVTGASLYAGTVARFTNTSNYYYFRLDVNINKTIGWQIRKVVAGVDTSLAGGTVAGLTHGITALYWARAKVSGTTLQLKVYSDSTGEPITWTASVTDSSISSAGQVGTRSERPVGNTSGGVDALYTYFTCGPYTDAAGKALAYDLEVAWGADLTADPATWVWTPITSDVYLGGGTGNPDDANQSAASTTFGRSDWSGQAEPAQLTTVLDNVSRRYAAYTPASTNYPNVVRGTPVRLRLLYNWVRFLGFANGWPASWDLVTNDPVVNLSAFGALRRLGQGTSPIRNVLTRYHVGNGAAAVWPFDDGASSTQAANAVPNGPPMIAASGVTFGLAPQVDNNPPLVATSAAARCPSPAPAGDTLTASAVNIATSGELHVDFWRNMTAEPDASETRLLMLDLTGGAAAFATIEIRARMSQISPAVVPGWKVIFAGGGTLDTAVGVGSPGSSTSPFDAGLGGLWHNVHLQLVQSGSNIIASIYIDGSVADSKTFASVTLPTMVTNVHVRNDVPVGGGIGNLDLLSVHAINGTSLGAPSWSIAQNRYNGELVTDRLTRLCKEQGVQLAITGTTTTTMGPQPTLTFLDLLRECEAADLGQLYDGQGAGLGYITRNARYSPPAAVTVDASQEQLSALKPQDDDQQIRNRWNLTRSDGSSVVVSDDDPTHALSTKRAGTYEDSATVNLSTDDQMLGQGTWRVRVGTIEGFRYPTLPLDFFRNPEIAGAWLDVDLLGRIDVTNLPAPHPLGTLSLVVNGYFEAVGDFAWDVVANCSSHQPWNVYALDTNFPLDYDGQTLGANLLTGATTMSVATAAGKPLLSTSAGDYPAVANVAGWPITITAVSGGSSPQTATINAAPNTATIPSGTSVTGWNSPVLGL